MSKSCETRYFDIREFCYVARVKRLLAVYDCWTLSSSPWHRASTSATSFGALTERMTESSSRTSTSSSIRTVWLWNSFGKCASGGT